METGEAERVRSREDEPLPMSDSEWATRLKRSRQALDSWRHEARLPWADNPLMLSIAETEVASLESYASHVPMRLSHSITPLVHDWDEFRLWLMARC